MTVYAIRCPRNLIQRGSRKAFWIWGLRTVSGPMCWSRRDLGYRTVRRSMRLGHARRPRRNLRSCHDGLLERGFSTRVNVLDSWRSLNLKANGRSKAGFLNGPGRRRLDRGKKLRRCGGPRSRCVVSNGEVKVGVNGDGLMSMVSPVNDRQGGWNSPLEKCARVPRSVGLSRYLALTRGTMAGTIRWEVQRLTMTTPMDLDFQ